MIIVEYIRYVSKNSEIKIKGFEACLQSPLFDSWEDRIQTGR